MLQVGDKQAPAHQESSAWNGVCCQTSTSSTAEIRVGYEYSSKGVDNEIHDY